MTKYTLNIERSLNKMTNNKPTKQKFNIRAATAGKLYDFNRFLIWTEQYTLTDKVTLLFTENNFNVNYGKIERFKSKSMYILINNIAILAGHIQYEGMKKQVIKKLKKNPSTLQDYIKGYYLTDKPFKSCNFIEPIKKPKEVLYNIRFSTKKEFRKDMKRKLSIGETFKAHGLDFIVTRERYNPQLLYEMAIYVKIEDCYILITIVVKPIKDLIKQIKAMNKEKVISFIKKFDLDTKPFGTYK